MLDFSGWVDIISADSLGKNYSLWVLIITLAFFGFFTMFEIIIHILSYLLSLCSFTPNFKTKYGEWAVITGAADGIGRAITLQLAKRKMNVFLIDYNAVKIEETVNLIKDKYPSIEIKTAIADFSRVEISDHVFQDINKKLNNIDIGILFNNVGTNTRAAYLHEVEPESIDRIIRLNILMSRIVLPRMISKRKGVIINQGSGSGYMEMGSPLYQIYSGTKAFVDFFSRSLYYEMKDKGVTVQVQHPLFVSTQLSRRRAGLITPSPSKYAEYAVSSIGHGGPVVIPYPMHKILLFFLELLPKSFAAHIITGMNKTVRIRAEAKARKEKYGK